VTFQGFLSIRIPITNNPKHINNEYLEILSKYERGLITSPQSFALIMPENTKTVRKEIITPLQNVLISIFDSYDLRGLPLFTNIKG
jgi:hypothetical protein